jgi:hypothetical protein
VIERQPLRTPAAVAFSRVGRGRPPRGSNPPRFQQAQPGSRACAQGRWPAGCRRLIAGGRLNMVVVTRGALSALPRRQRYRRNPFRRSARPACGRAGSTRPAARSLLGVPPAGGIQVIGWQSSPALGWTPGEVDVGREEMARPAAAVAVTASGIGRSPILGPGGRMRPTQRPGWPEGPPEVSDREGTADDRARAVAVPVGQPRQGE